MDPAAFDNLDGVGISARRSGMKEKSFDVCVESWSYTLFPPAAVYN